MRKDFHISLDQQPITVRFSSSKGKWVTGTPKVVDRHQHSYYELQLIIKGTMTVQIERQKFSVKTMQGILIAPNVNHEVCPNPGEFERRTFRLHLGNGWLKECLQKQEKMYWTFSIDEEMMEAFLAFLEECEGERPLQTDMQQAELSRLMIRIVRKLSLFDQTEGNTHGKRPDFRLDQIEEMEKWLMRNYANRGGMPRLAKTLTMSVRQLQRFIQSVYGMSFQEKINALRMDQAALLLETSDMTVTEISFAVGYGSVSTFYQTFESFYSMTPKEYRKRHRDEK